MIKRVFYILFSLISIILLTGNLAQAALKIQEVTSKGGLTAWLVEDHSIPVVSFQFSFEAGATQVPAGQEGLTDLLSHLLDEGAGPYSAQEFNQQLQKYALQLTFKASMDEFSTSLRTTSKYLKEAAALLKISLTQPRFGPKEFEKIRTASISALRNQEKMPPYIASKAFREIVFASHPYSKPSSGTVQSLQSLTPQHLKAFMEKGFTKDTLKIGVCGDITPAQLQEILDQIFQDLPEKSALPAIPPFKYPQGGRTKIIQAPFPQSYVLFAQEGLDFQHPDFIPLILLNQVLGDAPTSRLFEEIRVKRGNAYSVSSTINNNRYAFMLGGEIGSDNARVLESVKLVKEIWADVKEKGITQEELEEAKSHILGGYVLNLTTSLQIAALAHHYQRRGYPIDYPEKRSPLIEKITLAQLNAFAKRFLNPENLTFIVVGSPKEK